MLKRINVKFSHWQRSDLPCEF